MLKLPTNFKAMWISEKKLEKIKSDWYDKGVESQKVIVETKIEYLESFYKAQAIKQKEEIMQEMKINSSKSIVTISLGNGNTSNIYVLDNIDLLIKNYNTAVYENANFIFVTDYNGLVKSIQTDRILEIKQIKK